MEVDINFATGNCLSMFTDGSDGSMLPFEVWGVLDRRTPTFSLKGGSGIGFAPTVDTKIW